MAKFQIQKSSSTVNWTAKKVLDDFVLQFKIIAQKSN